MKILRGKAVAAMALFGAVVGCGTAVAGVRHDMHQLGHDVGHNAHVAGHYIRHPFPGTRARIHRIGHRVYGGMTTQGHRIHRRLHHARQRASDLLR